MAEPQIGTKPDDLQSPQEKQFAQFQDHVLGLLTKHGTSYNDLSEKLQKEIKGQASEITKLTSSFESVRADYAKRFSALAEHYQRGGEYRGRFPSAEHAANFGRLIRAIMERDSVALAELEKAAVTPGKGTEGGYVVSDVLLPGIVRNVEEAGVFERNCPAVPVTTLSGGTATRTTPRPGPTSAGRRSRSSGRPTTTKRP